MVVLIMTLVTLVNPVSAQKSPGKEPIKIGLVAPLIGMMMEEEVFHRDGALYAVKEINAAGGVLGRPLEIVIRNDQAKPAIAAAVTKELCTTEDIKFAVAPPLSSTARAVMPIFWRYKVPAIVGGAMADELLQEGCPYYYRTCNSNGLCAEAMLSILKLRKWQKPAVVYVNDFFGQSMLKVLQTRFPEMGLEMVAVASHGYGEPDMTPQTRKLLAGNPDVIILFSHMADPPNVMRAARTMGYKGDFVGYSSMFRNPTREIGGEHTNGLIFPTGSSIQGMYSWYRPGYAAFRIKLDAELGEGIFPNLNAPKEPASEQLYHMIQIIKQGIEAAGSIDPDKYMQALIGRRFSTVLDDISFPNAPKSWEGITDPKALFIREYVGGHLRVWSKDPKCIETFESTRIQAEEQTYRAGGEYKRGVTIKRFFKKWQEMLRANQTKIQGEIDAKEANLNITPKMADMYRETIKEILAMKF
jgi:branched-chain amino acid transport system substrate-binding protein